MLERSRATALVYRVLATERAILFAFILLALCVYASDKSSSYIPSLFFLHKITNSASNIAAIENNYLMSSCCVALSARCWSEEKNR